MENPEPALPGGQPPTRERAQNLDTIVGLPCPRLARGQRMRRSLEARRQPRTQQTLKTKHAGEFHVRYRYRQPRHGPGRSARGRRAHGHAAHHSDVRDPLFPDDPSPDEAPEGTPQSAAALSKGDEVVTAGGMLGKVTKVNDSYVTVEVSELAEKPVEIIMQKSRSRPCCPREPSRPCKSHMVLRRAGRSGRQTPPARAGRTLSP